MKPDPTPGPDAGPTAHPLERLGLPRRVRAPLRRAGIHTVEALAELTDAELIQIPRIGAGSIPEIRAGLARWRDRQATSAPKEPTLAEEWSLPDPLRSDGTGVRALRLPPASPRPPRRQLALDASPIAQGRGEAFARPANSRRAQPACKCFALVPVGGGNPKPPPLPGAHEAGWQPALPLPIHRQPAPFAPAAPLRTSFSCLSCSFVPTRLVHPVHHRLAAAATPPFNPCLKSVAGISEI